MAVSAADRSGHSRARLDAGESTRFKTFALAVVLLNFVALGLATVHAPSSVPSQLPDVLAWTVLVALAGLVPLSSGKGPSLAMDLPLLLAAAFVFGPFASGLIALLGAVDIREMRREVSWSRALWKRSQTSLSVMCASVIFARFGELGDWPITPLVALLALAADAVVNYVIVGYGTSLRMGLPLGSSLSSMRIGSPSAFFLSYICFGFLGILVAEAYAAFGLAGVLASVAPIILGRQAFVHRSRLDHVEQSLAESAIALRHVDERIASERRDERARIAAALHDEVLQDLYNVTIRAQVLRQDLLSGRLLDLEDDLPAVVRASEAAGEDLLEVIQGLRSASVGHAGLVETLSLFARHLQDDSGLQVVVSLDSSVRSTAERELIVYQIAREALANSARHSRAKTVWLSLSSSPDLCEAVVEDDGCGFDLEEVRGHLHFGLQLMKERAASIGGELEIRSSLGSGTVVRLRFRP
ncbi:MAG: sensor histidine kinase [Actinomycetota bacterium]